MRKMIFIVAIISFFSCISFAHASTFDFSIDDSNFYILTSDTNQQCRELFGDPEDSAYPAFWIQKGLTVIKYIGIVFLFVFSTIDFIKAITEQDNDLVIKAAKKSGKRLIYVVLLFFVPVLVNFLMNLLGLYGTCGYGESEVIGYVNS